MKFKSKYKFHIHENIFENVVCEMTVILSRGKWVNIVLILCYTVYQLHDRTSVPCEFGCNILNPIKLLWLQLMCTFSVTLHAYDVISAINCFVDNSYNNTNGHLRCIKCDEEVSVLLFVFIENVFLRGSHSVYRKYFLNKNVSMIYLCMTWWCTIGNGMELEFLDNEEQGPVLIKRNVSLVMWFPWWR